jgi:hypothetical protein
MLRTGAGQHEDMEALFATQLRAFGDVTGRPLAGTSRRRYLGQRPSFPAVATGTARLQLSLLRDLQRVVDLDAEVSDWSRATGACRPNADIHAPRWQTFSPALQAAALCSLRWKRRPCFLDALNAQGIPRSCRENRVERA